MGIFFAYTLKVGICLIAYYLFYKLLFSRETFHRVNRIALVGLMLASFLIPLIHIELERNVVTGNIDIEQQLMMVGVGIPDEEVSEISMQQLIFACLLVVYPVGIAMMFVRVAVVYISLWKTLRRGKITEHEGLGEDIKLIVHDNSIAPFSWLNYIVVNEKDLAEDAEAILTHELGHIRQRHSWDILLTELAQIVQWWNPAIWLMRRELQTIHEYEADEYVLNQGINAKQYQLLIIQKAVGRQLLSVNSLNRSFIKKRITMMLKNKSNPWAKAKYALALPVAALCAIVFASPQSEEVSKELASTNWKKFATGDLEPTDPALRESYPTEHLEFYTHDENEIVTVFTVVEQAPEFPGGEKELYKYIMENLRYPKDCAEANIQGRVVLSFIVTKDGTITNPEPLKSPDERLTEEAKRVVLSMPKWKPGVQRGENVNVKYVLPVNFRLNGDEKKDSLIVRGIKDKKVVCIVDGKVSENWKEIKPSEIEEIEVVSNPSPKQLEKYGEGAKDGIIFITTKK